MPKTTKCAIDKLPEVQRRKVLDALLEGKTLRQVARIGGVSHEAVRLYKSRTVIPAIRNAHKIQALEQAASLTEKSATLTKEIVQSSPFRERLEKLWNRVDRNLDRAETAVRVTTDKNGNEVVLGPDLMPIAPLMNQAHKNLELLGRVTGELETSAGANVAIQIVMPSAQSQMPRVADLPQDGPIIDVAVIKR